jgi:protein-S-isoprenylcysteine O-methyltransferase Ste14
VEERDYIYLSFGWITFCLLHSLFAAIPVKRIIAQRSGKLFTYYRLLYSIGSFIFLIFLLKYQLEKKETVLFFNTAVIRIASAILILSGLVIMIISAMRYFIPVMGLAIFTKQKASGELLESGIHGLIRHPLYAGTLLFIWGLFLFFPFGSNLIACISITIYTFIGIRFEEEKLLIQFGEVYKIYCQRVPMIFPKLHLRAFK